MTRIDESRPFIAVRIAILTMSDTRTPPRTSRATRSSSMIEEAGHQVAGRALVKDDIGRNPRARSEPGSPIPASTW